MRPSGLQGTRPTLGESSLARLHNENYPFCSRCDSLGKIIQTLELERAESWRLYLASSSNGQYMAEPQVQFLVPGNSKKKEKVR